MDNLKTALTIKSLFISRNLSQHSILFQLKDEGMEIYNQSLIDFSIIENEQFPDFEWIFFYSRNAVKYFFEQKVNQNRDFGKKRFGVMGTGSQKALLTFGLEAEFVGRGEPQKIAKDFFQLTKSDKILFIRAKQSKQSVESFFVEKQYESIAVYDNVAKSNPQIPYTDVAILTSPLNATGYFIGDNTKSKILISMGTTTHSYILERYQRDSLIPEESNEKELLKIIQGLLSKG